MSNIWKFIPGDGYKVAKALIFFYLRTLCIPPPPF
jgi:hypothetical protein